MATLDSGNSNFNEEKDLRLLLEAYGSSLPLEAIAFTYCQAKRNVSDACTILFEMHKNTLKNSAFRSNDRLEAAHSIRKLDPSYEKNEKNEKNVKSTRSVYRAINPKKGSISVGTVSSVLGKGNIHSKPLKNEPCKTMKPLRFLTTSPISVIQSEEPLGINTQNGTVKENIDEFLVSMLGDGFQLDSNTVHDVLGICGHDINKHDAGPQDLESSPTDLTNFTISSSVEETDVNLNHEDKDEYCIPRQIVDEIFNFQKAEKELPKRKIIRSVRSRVFGKPVTQPFFGTPEIHPTVVKEKQDFQNEDDNDDEEDSYDILRKNVKEYWETMKEYTKSAVEAFVRGDHIRAAELMKEGNMCRKMARETEEISAEKITESRVQDRNSVISLDLKGQASRDVIRLLKSHLLSLSGIPSIEFLKVICECNVESGGKNKKKMSHRKLVMKMLERESIVWSEEEEGVMVINICEIDPGRLTFSRKDT